MTCIGLKLSQVRWNSGVALVERYHFTTASTWSEVMHLYGGSFAFHRRQNRLNIHTTHKLLKWVPCRNGEFIRAPAVNKIFFPVLWLAVLADPFYLFIYFIVFLMWDPIFVCITHAKQGWRGSKDVENPKRKTLKDVLQMFNEEEGCKASVKPLVALANMHGFRFMYSTLPSDFCHEVTWRPFRTWTVWFSSEQTSR